MLDAFEVIDDIGSLTSYLREEEKFWLGVLQSLGLACGISLDPLPQLVSVREGKLLVQLRFN